MSVAEDWVKGNDSSVSAGRDKTYIMGYWYDNAGNKFGAILTKRYVTTDNGMDYYKVMSRNLQVISPRMHLQNFPVLVTYSSSSPFLLPAVLSPREREVLRYSTRRGWRRGRKCANCGSEHTILRDQTSRTTQSRKNCQNLCKQ